MPKIKQQPRLPVAYLEAVYAEQDKGPPPASVLVAGHRLAGDYQQDRARYRRRGAWKRSLDQLDRELAEVASAGLDAAELRLRRLDIEGQRQRVLGWLLETADAAIVAEFQAAADERLALIRGAQGPDWDRQVREQEALCQHLALSQGNYVKPDLRDAYARALARLDELKGLAQQCATPATRERLDAQLKRVDQRAAAIRDRLCDPKNMRLD